MNINREDIKGIQKVKFGDVNGKECFYSNGILYMRILQYDLDRHGIKNINAISLHGGSLTCFQDNEIVNRIIWKY